MRAEMSASETEFSLSRAWPMSGCNKRGQHLVAICQDVRRGRNRQSDWLQLVVPPLQPITCSSWFACRLHFTLNMITRFVWNLR
jgi:hypothetical protein